MKEVKFIQELHYNCDTTIKLEYVNDLLQMNNEDLLDEAFNAQAPDEWDGMFTKQGAWEKQKSIEILKYKLKQTKFI